MAVLGDHATEKIFRTRVFFRGLDVLGEISLSSSRQSGFAKAAMECLLDSNLPAKYAMTGALSSNNIIQDGFYDCGPVSNVLIVSPFLG